MALATDSRVPVLRNDNGTWRVGATRVTLDSVVSAFHQGSTPEQIQNQFPALDLADIYEVVAYYLRHRMDADHYLAERKKSAGVIRDELERRFPPSGFRDRLKERLKK